MIPGMQADLFSEAELNDLQLESFDKAEYIVDADKLPEIARAIRRVGKVAFDVETTGYAKNDQLVGAALAWEDHDITGSWTRSVYIPVGHITQTPQLDVDLVCEFFRDLFQDVVVIPFNAAFEIKVMKGYGVEIPKFDDARYYTVADNDKNVRESLKDLAKKHLGMEWGTIKEVCSRRVKQRNEKGTMVTRTILDIAGTSIAKLGRYCRSDAEAAWLLFKKFQPLTTYATPIIDLERQVTPVVVAMEERGIKVDLPATKAKLEETKNRLQQLEEEIIAKAGKLINLNSPKQVSELLFDELGLRMVNDRSVDVNTLQELKEEHQIPKLMLEYRELEKLRSTYLEPLLEKNLNGRIYTSLNQLGTESGRFSSSKPNMQNVPADDVNGNPGIRKLFVPTEGMIMLDYDYSQIEGRVFAHVSQDKTLLEYYQNGGDIHTATSEKLGIPRKLAKTINFAIIYGAASRKLSESMQKEGFAYDQEQAKELIRDFWKLYSGGSKWANSVKNSIYKTQSISTVFGRRRVFPEILTADKYTSFSLEREAVNFVIQGTAADILKYAMVGTYKALRLAGFPAYPLLTVHDELLFEGPESKYEQADRIIKYQMENSAILSLPMVVEGKKGRNWAEVH